MAGSLVRTLRIRTRRKVGNLGILTTALGDAGTQVGEIITVKIGHRFTLRDFHIVFDDEGHLDNALQAVGELADSEVVEVRNDVTFAHRGGKTRTVSRVPLSDISSLHTSVTPGAREITNLIDDDPAAATLYTSIPKTVGILSDGAGLIGAGKVRAEAMMPPPRSASRIALRKSGSQRRAVDCRRQQRRRFGGDHRPHREIVWRNSSQRVGSSAQRAHQRKARRPSEDSRVRR